MTMVSGKKKPLAKKELLMSSMSKSMDYLDEDSDEVYDDVLNYTGEISFFNYFVIFELFILFLSQRNACGK